MAFIIVISTIHQNFAHLLEMRALFGKLLFYFFQKTDRSAIIVSFAAKLSISGGIVNKQPSLGGPRKAGQR
jgi:hypothetical protein